MRSERTEDRTQPSTNISMMQVTDSLLDDGVKLFADAFIKLLDTLQKQRETGAKVAIDRLQHKLPEKLQARVQASLKDWQLQGKVRKLWARDPSLWSGRDEGQWLDWLTITDDQLAHVKPLTDLADEMKKSDFTHALLLGMGGSSLCPEVISRTFGTVSGFPELHVLDSTDPAQVKKREQQVDLAKTIFIVSSKSGSTLEPNIFKQYFFDRVAQLKGADKAGQQFIAITDPGSKMQKVAEQDRFRHTFFGVPGIGGRYSALSNFGMVPSAMIGVDVPQFLSNAEQMVHACTATVPIEENPGVVLGTILGVLAASGRDKLTLIASPGISDLGAWLEQLLAESTGKQGRGIIPVDREKVGSPDAYGQDRLFAYLRLDSGADPEQDKAVAALET